MFFQRFQIFSSNNNDVLKSKVFSFPLEVFQPSFVSCIHDFSLYMTHKGMDVCRMKGKAQVLFVWLSVWQSSRSFKNKLWCNFHQYNSRSCM